MLITIYINKLLTFGSLSKLLSLYYYFEVLIAELVDYSNSNK